MVRAAILRTDAVAVPAQIGTDDMKMLGEAIGDAVPGDMRQRVSVQQEQGWTLSAMAQVDACPAGLDLDTREPFEHPDIPCGLLRREGVVPTLGEH
jgi:hypothetical protein